ncbi:hypothetical protein C8J57DRAFT_1661178 [Mycena rebaudengoi]|nr:hypothetical protein C8J57DRAFT_1661178 [Mycena rebaudengoi]
MQFTGLVAIVSLTIAVFAHPVVVNLFSAELVRSSDGTCPPSDPLIEGCLPGRDNGVTELKHDPQNTGTYDGPIERCVVEACPFLTTPHTPDSAHPTSQTSPNTLAFRNGSAPCYISVRSGTFRSRAPEHLPTCRQLLLPVPRTALRKPPLRTCAPPCAPAPNIPAHLRCAASRTGAPHPASRKRSLHAPPCVVALNPLHTCAQLPCAPALNPCAPAQLPGPELRIICRPADNSTHAHPSCACAHSRAPALNTCALRTQPPSLMRLPPTAPPALPPASPARLAPAPAP